MRIPVVVSGACGRMGTIIRSMLAESTAFSLVGALERTNHPLLGRKLEQSVILTSELPPGDYVVIDFSSPEGTLNLLRQTKNPLVIGTTGLTEETRNLMEKLSASTAIVWAANMSIGVYCFFQIVKRAAELLKDYEVEILETHHHHKKDAPSGTAREIARIVCEAKKLTPESSLRFGRSGFTGERKPEEIGIHAMRLADIVGEHSVFFGKTGEVIELSHRCFNRASFAAGALQAASFVWKKSPGLYTMEDVIEEKKGEENVVRE